MDGIPFLESKVVQKGRQEFLYGSRHKKTAIKL
jgi:hypothetical protein